MEQNLPTITSQAVRFRDMTVQFQTVVLKGVAYLRLQDVKQRFPTVSAFAIDDIQLSFLCDESGNNLEPLRIQARPDKVIEALEPLGQSNVTIRKHLDRIASDVQEISKSNQLILANTQETLLRLKHVMTQLYEIHEYTTPRYFFILPVNETDGTLTGAVQNLFILRYKLYFLCECSDEPNALHIAPHDGYLIRKPQEFINKYGPYLRTTLNVARIMLNVSGFVVPQLGHVSTTVSNAVVPIFGKINKIELGGKFDRVEQLLNRNNPDAARPNFSELKADKSQQTPLQGAELRELESYLGTVDSKHSLGNLYRTITDDGHVRWVCLEHYSAISYNAKMSEHIRQFEAFGGKFDQKTHEAVVTEIILTSKNIDTLCDALKKGFKILSLTFERCCFNDANINKLFETIINLSSIRRLIMSHTTVKTRSLLRTSEYVCGCISVHINNKSLNIRFFERFQDGDIKLLVQLWSQNRVCRLFDLSGGDFRGHGTDLTPCLKTNEESKTLTLKYLNNIEFLCDILNNKSSLLNHLQLSFWTSSPSVLSRFCETLGINSTLTELSIMDHHCFDDDEFTNQLLTTLHGHKSIKRLTLHVYHVEPLGRKEDCLVNTLHRDSFIARLHISESIISKKFIEAIVYASQKLNSLMHLEFYDCQIDDDQISSLQLLHAAENLTQLIFSKEPYWFVTMSEMRRQLQEETLHYQNKKLEQLIRQEQEFSKIYLYQQELTDRDMEIVIQEGIIDKQCKELYLGSNKFTSIGVSILADSLNNNNQKLETLWLFENQVSDDAVYFIAKTLEHNNTTLKKLDLGKNNITDQGTKHLARMLETNTILTHLYLNENEITDDGVRVLANAIEKYNTNIQLLHLTGNKSLTDGCVDSLLRMIEHNQSLTVVRVYDCNFSEKGKEMLKLTQKSKQNFEIWAYDFIR